MTFRLREKVEAVEALKGRGARLKLASGKEIVSETVLYATGRQGDTEQLGLGQHRARARQARADPGRRDLSHRRSAHLRRRRLRRRRRAGGDGDGAGTDRGAARLRPAGRATPALIPSGVYAIPELALVGRTEEQLTDEAVPYVAGIARWSELARGVISGDRDGILKLLVSVEDRSILGVHVLGTRATDLVHIGQAVMAAGAGGLDFLVTAVFNYPTFAESYKVAALDADNRIKAMKSFGV